MPRKRRCRTRYSRIVDFTRTNGIAEFRRLVFGFIDDPVIRSAKRAREERPCLTTHKVVVGGLRPYRTAPLVMLKRCVALTSVSLCCRILPSGDNGGSSGCGGGGNRARQRRSARRLKQIFYEDSGVTTIIIKRWSWHRPRPVRALVGCKVRRRILPSFPTAVSRGFDVRGLLSKSLCFNYRTTTSEKFQVESAGRTSLTP